MSLREQCKQKLKLAFDSIRAISSSLTFILVVDDASLKVISSTIKMMELVNYGINSIERLELTRKKFHKIEAVYLIHPESYDKLLIDFKDEPQYAAIHILTLTKIPIHIMDELSSNKSFAKRVKTLKQLNFNFILHSDNEFLVEKAGRNYSKETIIGEGEDTRLVIDTTVQELATVVTSLSQFYIVQIFYSQASVSGLAEKISIQLKDKLEKMFDLYAKFNVQNYTSSAPQTTLLILDRSYDAITPIMRDFHYMPLLYDMKDCHKHRIDGEGKEKKVYVMDENEPIFEKFKNEHISRAINGITSDFEVFSREHVGAKMEKNEDGNIGLDKMTEVMKKIPQYNELKDKYSFHMTMAAKIMKNYEKGKYKISGELEQNLASQVSESGKALKPADLFNEVVKTAAQIENEEQKAKMLLVALLTLDLKPKQKTNLLQILSSCPNYADCYKNLQKICGPMLYKMGPKRAGKDDLILQRHQPRIQETVRKISEGGQSDLKYLRVGTEVRGKAPQKATLPSLGRRKIGATIDKVLKPRLIIFFCTSISYSEMRALSAFQNDYHIIYGSHSFTTQHQFLSLVNSLEADQL